MQTPLENFAIDFKKNLTSPAIDTFPQTILSYELSRISQKSLHLRKPLPQRICEDYVIDCSVMIVYYNKKSKMRIFIVDAFTDKLFRGNPAAVCILDEEISDELKQKIAAEMNLSETAFVLRQDSGFDLRWFTPVAEVELCGHATLASAHILWHEGILQEKEEAIFRTLQSGILRAGKTGDNIVLNFPSIVPQITEHEDAVRSLFSNEPFYIGLAGNHFFVELPSVKHVTEYKPNFTKISRLPKYGLIITSASEGEFDFVSRFFAPAVGVNEDPVTGSAHCSLCTYWAGKLEKKKMRAYQASKRGGVIGVELKEDRVYLSGNAVTFLIGEINV